MKIVAALKEVYKWGPLLFGVGFIAPLIAQSLDAASATALLGLSNLQFGLAVGATAGMIAKVRGSWI